MTRLRLRDFRSYAAAEVALGERLTVVHGPNGAGKTNLLEALYFGCTGRSCRTSNERELVRFDARRRRRRVEVDGRDRDGEHELSVGFEPGRGEAPEGRRRAGRAPARRAAPPAGQRLPARPPRARQGRRRRCAARTSTRSSPRCGRRAPATRRAVRQALAQRNALLARVRAGRVALGPRAPGTSSSRATAIALRDDRAAAVELLRPRFAEAAAELGLAGAAELRYRPRSKADSAEALAAELAERLDSDLERGFTAHGPHRDDLALLRDGRELRAYGSQGEQRLALLALLLAERDALEDERGAPPLLLLDDVMSELDADRRERLVGAPARGPGARHDDRPRARAGRRRRGRRAPARRGRRRRAGAASPHEAPRAAPAAHAIAALADRLAPQTTLAEVQRVWPDAVGEVVAAQASRRASATAC